MWTPMAQKAFGSQVLSRNAPIILISAEASGLLNLATIPFYGEEGPPPPPAKVKNEVIEEELQSTESTSSVGIQYKNNISFYKRFMKKVCFIPFKFQFTEANDETKKTTLSSMFCCSFFD